MSLGLWQRWWPELIRVAAVQAPRCASADAEFVATSLLEKLNRSNIDLVVFPEKWITEVFQDGSRYFKDLIDLFRRFSADTACAVVPGSFSLTRDGKLYNTAPFIEDGSVVGFQDKISLYRGERKNYTGGSEVRSFPFHGTRVSVAVCYDLDFPYFAKIAAGLGSRIIVNPSLIHQKFHGMWKIYVLGRSLENRMPVISVNSISEPFSGNSIITSMDFTPDGVFIQEKNCGTEIITESEIDENGLEEAVTARLNEDPGRYEIRR